MRVLVLGSDPDYLVNFRGDLLRQIADEGGEAVGASPGPADGPHARAIRALGARYEHAPMVRNRITPVADARAMLGLVGLLRRVRPDALFAYTIKPVVYGCLAARWTGVPVIAALVPGLGSSFEGAGWRARLRARMVAALYRAGLRTARVVFFQNEDDRGEFVRRRILRADQPTVLLDGSGVNLERFRPAPQPERPVFLWVGRLLREKGVEEFVEAARRVRRLHPDAEFRVVGYHDGAARASLEPALRAAHDAGDIVFAGRVADIRPELARATAFVLPSWYREGIPRSALEALAMGRAIVTTDWIGCRETVRRTGEPNGLLVPVRDTEALVAAVRRLIEEPGLAERMGRASRAYAEERFEVGRVNRMILDALGFVPASGAGAGTARAAAGATAGSATHSEAPPCARS
jgi:glycosyltransferase involved in cell wall biosynthesis